jgi:hypothetical protein
MRSSTILLTVAFTSASVSACTSISVTTDKPGEVLVCDGTWQQNSMFGHTSANRRMLVYSNPDATKIQLETFGQTEGVCRGEEEATCYVSIKGKKLVVTSTFPKWSGTQVFTFDADTAHMTFGAGGLDEGQVFSGTCRRKSV